ncbi:hypothetical protein ABGB16_22020 [Micromonospora sp. B11E3]|uniref:hypothetical protein n=1 Tax=Micromonospora sp. B11E3 TaxID=3153562 RepID=UPI00325EC8BF
MAMNRMNRTEFFDKLAGLDEQQLKTALWNLYWRGTAAVRERIESQLHPSSAGQPRRPAATPVDPRSVRDEVIQFVTLARSGAYIAGDRRVSPRHRTRWRSEFARLAAEARKALRAPEPDPAAEALEQLIDLARETRDYDYFRSEDPMEAARFVVSEAAALLWGHRRDRYGFTAFAASAAPQLVRWESRYGWTRRGYGQISQKETSLAAVLNGMLTVPDVWVTFAGHYLDALDRTVAGDNGRDQPWRSGDHVRAQRTADLAEWHAMLLRRLADTEAEDLLDRLIEHRLLGGPELDFLRARLAHQRGDAAAAGAFITAALDRLPGHQEMLDFAVNINTPLPARAQKILKGRSYRT